MLEMRNSERGDLGHCVQKWYWSTVEGLAPNRDANPLWFGSAVHDALADWYLPGLERGPHPAETFSKKLLGDRVMLVTTEEEEQVYLDARELGVNMLEAYVEKYGKDDNWFVIATEQTFQVRIARPEIKLFGQNHPRRAGWLRFVGTTDGVYRDLNDGQIHLMEHKTAASIRTDHLPLDNQAGAYWALLRSKLVKMGVLKEDEDMVGIMYNFLRKAMQDTRPRNEDGMYTNKPTKQHYLDALEPFYELTGKETVAVLEELAEDQKILVLGEASKSQPPEFFVREPVYRSRAERKTQIKRIQEEALFSEAYRNGDLPITKSPSKDCGWCAFERMCQLDESGDQAAVADFKETQFHWRDPYAAHQKKSAE